MSHNSVEAKYFEYAKHQYFYSKEYFVFSKNRVFLSGGMPNRAQFVLFTWLDLRADVSFIIILGF